MKHNYTRAGKIYNKFFELCCDPWTLDDTERQQGRRDFMHRLTHGEDMSDYLEYIQETIQYVCLPHPTDSSKVYDFDLMRTYQALAEDIRNFTN